VPDAPALPKLSEHLCFALYTASRAMTQLYRCQLAELGLTYPQYLAMVVLWERGCLSVKDLGAALELDSGTLSPLLKRLEAHGLVLRERSPQDERSVVVRPTAAGLALRERVAPVPAAVLQATGLQLAELVDLREILTRLTVSVTTATDPSKHQQKEN
jgi:MarR family transcriptional regulator, organic hydroperoxide resistance regulator